jgi:hypothetical protein
MKVKQMEKQKPFEKLDQLIFNRAYDPAREPPPDQIVLRIEQKNIGSLQNLVTITGFEKNGKGKYIGGITAALLTRQEIFSITARLPYGKEKISFWDTEQGDFEFYKSMENIKKLAGISNFPPGFNAFNVREDDPHTVLRMIDRFLSLNPDTGALILDGLTDLVLSYNDEVESKKLVNILKKWSKQYNCLIIGVLHKGKSTQSTVGHLGAMANRAAQSVLAVEKIKERGTIQLRPDFLRSADDFTPIEIYYNTQGHQWEQTAYIPEPDEKVKRLQLQPHEYDKEHHRHQLVRIFTNDLLLTYDELVQSIKEMYATGEKWAKACVPYLMKENLIFKNHQKLFTTQNINKLFQHEQARTNNPF